MIHSLPLAASPESSIRLWVDFPAWAILGFVFVLGTICGSFLNVCVHRLPKYEHGQFWPALRGLWWPPSSCPRCGQRIAWHDNVPVLGWLLLRGRCRNCKMWISPQYPLVEFSNGCLFALVYWLEVPLGPHAPLTASCLYTELGPQAFPGLGAMSPDLWVHLRVLYHLVLIEALLAASLIDLRLMIIPDTVTLPAMAFGALGAAAIGRLNIVPVWLQEPRLARDFSYIGPSWLQWMVSEGPRVPEWITQHPHWHGLAASLAGVAVGGGVVWLVRALGTWALRREAMGDGDVVLMAMVGAFIGWQPVLIAFALAPIGALAYVVVRMAFRWEQEIPYGPYLSLGTLFTILAWQPVWGAFERIFSLGPLLLLFFAASLAMFTVLLLGIQVLKRLLGIPVYEEAAPGEWTAADQTHFFAGENWERHSGSWRKSGEWPGNAASRGSLNWERWRHGGR